MKKIPRSIPLVFALIIALWTNVAFAIVATSPIQTQQRFAGGIADVFNNYMESYYIEPTPGLGHWLQNFTPEMHCSYINSLMANDMIDQATIDANASHDPSTSVYVGTVTRQDGNHMWVVVFIARNGTTVEAYSYDVWGGTHSGLNRVEYSPGQFGYYVPEVGYVAPSGNDITMVVPDGPSSTVDGRKVRYGLPKPDYFVPMP